MTHSAKRGAHLGLHLLQLLGLRVAARQDVPAAFKRRSAGPASPDADLRAVLAAIGLVLTV